MKAINFVAMILLIVGGLNWGLVAAADFDLVATIFGMEFGETSAISKVVYGLVGLSSIVLAVNTFAKGNQQQSA